MRTYNLVILVLFLVAALIAPFFLRGPDGQPLMTLDDFIEVPSPSVSINPPQVYRWQDEHGVWQFGDDPPAGVEAQEIEIRDKITRVKADWIEQLEAVQAAGKPTGSGTATGDMPSLVDIYSGEALEQAKHAAELMGEHYKANAEALEQAHN